MKRSMKKRSMKKNISYKNHVIYYKRFWNTDLTPNKFSALASLSLWDSMDVRTNMEQHADTKHCSSPGLCLDALLPPTYPWFPKPHPLCLVPSLNTVPSTSFPVPPHHPFHNPTIPSETFPAKNCITSKPQKWLLGWFTSPFNHTAKYRSHWQPPAYLHTYIPTYAYRYVRTRSKTDNVGCMINESSIFMCCTAYTAPTYVCTLDGVPSIECSKHNVVSQHQLMLYEWYN